MSGSQGRPASGRPIGVLLMTYGSPSNAEELPAYLRSVRGGREPEPELLAEFLRRYEVVGWSPLIRITPGRASGPRSSGWPRRGSSG